MAQKTTKTRIQQKRELEVNWLKATSFVPLEGELIVYKAESDTDELPSGRSTPYKHPRFKVGDGKTTVTNLPFSTVDNDTGIVQFTNSTSSTSTTTAATPNSVKTAYDKAVTADSKAAAAQTAADGKAPKSHASSETTYGVATTSKYGHVKISNGDADTVASANGLAAGMDHKHSGLATKAEGAIFIEGSGTTDATAKTSTWIGTSDRVTEYYDGLAIRYKIGVAGQTTTTLNINGLGAKRVYRFNTTTLTTHFPVGSIITLIYHTDLNSGCWMCNDYDANSDTKMYVYRQTTGYNADYPLLISRTKAADIATKDSDGSKEAVYAVMWNDTTKVPTLNPSTGEVKATEFTGTTFTGTTFTGTFKGTATKATQDGSGNVITSTYATKTELTDAIATAITTALNTPV